MLLSGIVQKSRAIFCLENNIKVEGLLEAHLDAVHQQCRRLESLANALANKPSRSSMRTLAEEAFAIRAEVLNSSTHLLMRLKPALTPEQFSACENHIKDLLSKTLQPKSNNSSQTSNDEAHPELISLENNTTTQPNTTALKDTAATNIPDSTQANSLPNDGENKKPNPQALQSITS